jgi:hypothetical protein
VRRGEDCGLPSPRIQAWGSAQSSFSSTRKLLLEAGVKGKRDGRQELDPAEGRVHGIEDEVLFSWNDAGWDSKECRLSGPHPRFSEVLRFGNYNVCVPSRGQALCLPTYDREVLWYPNLGEDEVFWQGAIVDENFESCERGSLRGVNDCSAKTISSAAKFGCARSAVCRKLCGRESID